MKTAFTLLASVIILVVVSFFKCGRTEGSTHKAYKQSNDSAAVIGVYNGNQKTMSGSVVNLGILLDNDLYRGGCRIY